MNIPNTTLKYHLKYLEKQGIATIKFESGYKRYFVKNKLGQKEKEIVNLLRQEVPRNIILYMMFHIVCSQIELSKALEKKPPTIAFHLKKLKALGIIEQGVFEDGEVIMNEPVVIQRNIISNEILYYLDGKEIFDIIYNLLITCKNSLPGKDFVNDILNFIDDLFDLDKRKFPKKVNNLDHAIDTFIEFVYDVFPHPYHV